MALPPNTRELLLALRAEFYGGPLAHADAFRILPAVVEELEAAGRLPAPVIAPKKCGDCGKECDGQLHQYGYPQCYDCHKKDADFDRDCA